MPDATPPPTPPIELGDRRLRLTAYKGGPNPGYTIEPAPVRREWMDAFPNKWPYRCLPMSMANQAGWVVRTPTNFTVRWNGKHDQDALKITFPESADELIRASIVSHFGGGIVTIRLPWVFRTDPGIGLWVRGAANHPTDSILPLEGIVETDWDVNGFTMNWKVIKRNTDVFFREGDPVLMMTPYPFALLEAFDPDVRLAREDPELQRQILDANRKRHGVVTENIEKATQATERGEDNKPIWEKRYMTGTLPDGSKAPEHRTNFKLKAFTRGGGAPGG